MSPPWWQNAVVYEVYVRSFCDSDGDGIGDLAGVRRRLSHLVELGVDALWLTPFYRSPMADHGYDVADHTDVDPLFGALSDVDLLLADAHRLGLKVIIDIVPNHTSREHPWFAQALADPTSPARSRFVFRDGRGPRGEQPPNDWASVFGGPAWTRESADGQWYLHMFDTSQPDLDWQHPDVHDELLRILRFWLDRGVDGLRIDVAHTPCKEPSLRDLPPAVEVPPDDSASPLGQLVRERRRLAEHVWDRDEVLALYEKWRQVVDGYDGDRMTVGEVVLFDVERVARYVSPTRLHQAFNFSLLLAPWDADALRRVVADALAHFAAPTWVLSNHDVVRHATRFGGGETGRRRGVALTALLLALPGSTYLYQGEELGLEQVDVPEAERQDPVWLRSGDNTGRDGCRTPMPWVAAAPGHGFTSGQPWLPLGPDAAQLAVDAQQPDPWSTLSVYRRLLQARRTMLTQGDVAEVLELGAGLVAVRRGEAFAVLNTTGQCRRVPLAGVVLESTGAGAHSTGTEVVVPAESAVWLVP